MSAVTRDSLIWMARKTLLLVVLFFLASGFIFTAIQCIPGDPVALRLKNPDPEQVAEMRRELGLDEPWLYQYFEYIQKFVSGDWGKSLVTGRRVWDDVAERLPATIELALAALLLGVPVGLTAGLYSERRQYPIMSNIAGVLGALGLTIPIFWLGLLLMLIGSVWLQWFPLTGRFDYTLVAPEVTGFLIIDTVLMGEFGALAVAINHLALPAICLSLYPAAVVCGLLRARLKEPRLRALIVALRAKGLSSFAIIVRHVLRLLGGPLVTAVGTNFGALLGGAVLTETVFAWPGMGVYLVGGVLDRDIYIIQFSLLLVVLLIFVVVYISDCLTLLINPLVRTHAQK